MADDDLSTMKRQKARRRFHKLNAYGGKGSGVDTRVICTELVRQGLMDPGLQHVDAQFTLNHLSPLTVRGYHVWAVGYVRWMQRSRLATRVARPLAQWRAEQIAYQMGARARPNVKGMAVRALGEPLCWLIGWTISLMDARPLLTG